VEAITRRLKERRNRPGDETGFSLIELMIVLLIIAIILAVAIPTYLSARDRAENRAAQEILGHAVTMAEAEYAQSGSWSAGQILQPSFDANVGQVANAQNHVGTANGSSPGEPLDEQIVEDHGAQWLLVENATTGGWCFGELVVQSARSSALDGQATDIATGFDVILGVVPGPGTYFDAGKQYGGQCYVGLLPSGWQSTWSAATAAA